MTDLFGYTPPVKPFKDFRATKPKVADEKAQLALILGNLCNCVPESVKSGTIQATREWMRMQAESKKLLARKNASRQELGFAIARMRGFE